MRDILFRGKRKDNGEWVYGFYAEQDGHVFIVAKICDLQHAINGHNSHSVILYEVIPETVGQYTGLTDKSGTKIFEGDVLSVGCYSYNEPEDEACGEVVSTVYGNALIIEKDSGETDCCYLSDMRGSYTTVYEIIGNVHDNPELLN